MKDIFENRMVCEACNQETRKITLTKNGFQLRSWQCPSCKQAWAHPADQAEYDRFMELRSRRFNVKLRMVGNSYTISIPREIIDFENEMRQEMMDMEKIISLFLEEPEKLSIYFGRNVYNGEEDEEEDDSQ